MMSNQAKFFAALALCLLGSCGGGSVSTGGSPGVGGSAGGGDAPPTISVIAGNISVSTGFVDGQGAEARFSNPTSSVLDSHGSLFVADAGNWAIRRVSPTGLVQTFVTLPAFVSRLAIDANDVIYALVGYPAEIYKIKPDGTYSIVGGGHPCSLWGSSTVPIPCFPEHSGFVSDRSGNLFVLGPHGISRISPKGEVTVLVGPTISETYIQTGFPWPVEMQMSSFAGLVIDELGNLYTAQASSEASILRVSSDGKLSWVVRSLPLVAIRDLARLTNGEFILLAKVTLPGVAGSWNALSIVKLGTDGALIQIAGGDDVGANDGTGSNVQFNAPTNVTVDRTGNIWVTDRLNNTLRHVTPDGASTTVAGAPRSSGYKNGTAASARFYVPGAILGGRSGNLFVVDHGNLAIRKISSDGNVSVIAGGPGASGSLSAVLFDQIYAGLGRAVIDDQENLYLQVGYAIRRISASGQVTTLAGAITGPAAYVDGGGEIARFSSIQDLALDRAGNLIVADDEVQTCTRFGVGPGQTCVPIHPSALRRVSPNGTVSTLINDTGFRGGTKLCTDSAGVVRVLSFGDYEPGKTGGVLSQLDMSGSTPMLVRYAVIHSGQLDLATTSVTIACGSNGSVYVGATGTEDRYSQSGGGSLWAVEANGVVTQLAGLALTQQQIRLGATPWSLPFVNGLFRSGDSLYFSSLNGIGVIRGLH